MLTTKEYKVLFMSYLQQHISVREPLGLYVPVQYMLTLPAKRLRPVLTLLSADIFGGGSKTALPAALAVELFHNFTLMHDDIMDNAPLRRGQPTVHRKWDLNTAILSGDVMLIMAEQCLETYPPETFAALSGVFHTTAVKVCEGQQYDMDFETRSRVTLPEYLRMIEYKTAVLVAAAMKMGALTANASPEQAETIHNFGLHLGIAFQLKDDYLDTFGSPETFGKHIGGDIIAGKKSFLYVKAMELLGKEEGKRLEQLYSGSKNPTKKIEGVKQLFLKSKADVHARMEVEKYTESAFGFLEALTVTAEAKTALRDFATNLMDRAV